MSLRDAKLRNVRDHGSEIVDAPSQGLRSQIGVDLFDVTEERILLVCKLAHSEFLVDARPARTGCRTAALPQGPSQAGDLRHPVRSCSRAPLLASNSPSSMSLFLSHGGGFRLSEGRLATAAHPPPKLSPPTARRLLSDVASRYPAVTESAECPSTWRRLSRSPPPRRTEVANVPLNLCSV